MNDEYLLRTRLLALPTADSYRRGQFVLLENPGVADDKLYIGMQQTAGTYAYKEIPYGPISVVVIVQEGDSTIDAAVSTFDFDASDFNVTSSPAGEANIALAYGTSAGTPAEGNHTHDPFIPFIRLGFDDTLRSTSSTSTYTTAVTISPTLPSGTWTCEVNGFGRVATDAGGNLDVRVLIDGTASSVVTRSGPSTGSTILGAGGSKSSVASGARTFSLQFRTNSGTPDTVYMSNAQLTVNCYRTA